MTTPDGSPDATLDDVIDPTEQATPDHREHGKATQRPDDDVLEQRTEHERDEVGEA